MLPLPEDLTLVEPTWCQKLPGEATRCPGPSRAMRERLTGGEILPAHDYRNVLERDGVDYSRV
jgi:hypothetical protein